MTSILLAVVLLSATLTANDAGAATDSDVESAQFADRFYWALATAEEVDTGKPPSTHGPLGFAIRLHIPQRNPGTAASATPNAPMLRKSVADYGALSFVAGTLGSDHCLGSSGAAIDPSGKFVFMSGGIGSPGRLCGFVVDPVTGGWTAGTAWGNSRRHRDVTGRSCHRSVGTLRLCAGRQQQWHPSPAMRSVA